MNKKSKNPSFMDTVREVDRLEKEENIKLREKYKKISEQQREEHGKKLNREKIELLKSKQGIVEETNNLEDTESENQKTGRLRNFIYLNKWWLSIALIAAIIVTFLTTQLLTRERPDLTVMLLTDDVVLQNNSEKIEKYFENYIDDFNHNGKKEVFVYCLPLNEEEVRNDYTRGNASGVSTQFQMGTTLIVITDDEANKYISPKDTLLNLESEFPNDKDIKGTGLYLSNTDFMKKIGLDGQLDKDISIGIREVKEEYLFEKKMKKTFNKDFPVFKKIVDDLEG